MSADYECHITVECEPKDLEFVRILANGWKWKFSYIDGDPELGAGKRAFLTSHFKTLKEAHQQTDDTAYKAKCHDLVVSRKKIEHVILDTKRDTWIGWK